MLFSPPGHENEAAALPRSLDRALLAGLLDSAMDAIITVDEEQRIVLYHRAAERIFGWPTAQILGQPLARLSLSVKTVSTHKANLMQKMGLQKQSGLIRYALRHGLADQLES